MDKGKLVSKHLSVNVCIITYTMLDKVLCSTSLLFRILTYKPDNTPIARRSWRNNGKNRCTLLEYVKINEFCLIMY